jgi:hypothetical protein
MDAVVPRDTLPANVAPLLYRAAPLDTLLFRKEVRPEQWARLRPRPPFAHLNGASPFSHTHIHTQTVKHTHSGCVRTCVCVIRLCGGACRCFYQAKCCRTPRPSTMSFSRCGLRRLEPRYPAHTQTYIYTYVHTCIHTKRHTHIPFTVSCIHADSGWHGRCVYVCL